MASEHRKYKYMFLFKKRGKFEELDLHGRSIKDFWNYIYDMFDLKGEMMVQKLNGQEFTIREIKQLFEDLLENMMDDFSVISLNIRNLKTLEFVNCYSEHLEPIDKKIEEKGIDIEDDETIEKEGLSYEKITKDLSYDSLRLALYWFKELKLEKIAKGFDIRPKLLQKKEFSDLRQALEYFTQAREDKKNSFFYFYHITEKVKKSGSYKKILGTVNITEKPVKSVTKILNDNSIRGSRHEAEGSRLRNPTKEEIKLCENTIKKLIEAWIIESKINDKK